MHFESNFTVPRSRAEVAKLLDDDETITFLLPDTTIVPRDDGTRETRTPSPLGQSRDIRFIFRRVEEAGLLFEKICDGNIWRSLDGQIRLEDVRTNVTRVQLQMDGRTRALVPELMIRGPMRDQIEQMTEGLRARLGAE
jgi:carbon monoxide dehydrogenase subunit G